MDGQNFLNCSSMKLAPIRLHLIFSILVQTDQWTSGVGVPLWSNLLRATLPPCWKPCRQVCKSPKQGTTIWYCLNSQWFCSPGSKRVHYYWILHLWYWVLFHWASGLHCCTVSSPFSHCSSGYAWFTHLLPLPSLSSFFTPSFFPFLPSSSSLPIFSLSFALLPLLPSLPSPSLSCSLLQSFSHCSTLWVSIVAFGVIGVGVAFGTVPIYSDLLKVAK